MPLLRRAFAASVLFCIFAGFSVASGRGFRTQHMLEEHYQKYGKAFGNVTQDQYLRLAQQLRDTRSSKAVLEVKRSDGSGAKFDKRRGWFVAYEPDGTLKMFFAPKDGLRYFQWQATQSPSKLQASKSK